MTAAPLVSIGIPVYNGEKYLEETLDSVGDRFTIVVDDAHVDPRHRSADRDPLARHGVATPEGLLRDQPDGVTVSEIRDAFDTTRKFALPLLARLDGTGVTRRRDDLRPRHRRALPDVGARQRREPRADPQAGAAHRPRRDGRDWRHTASRPTRSTLRTRF